MSTQVQKAFSQLTLLIEGLEQDQTILAEKNFNKRADAIDFIEFHIIDRIESLIPTNKSNERLNLIRLRADKLKQTLETIDCRLFEEIRRKIRTGVYTGAAFFDMLQHYLDYRVEEPVLSPTTQYDNLDFFLNGILNEQPLPEPTKKQEPEMVFYQKTPARIILQLASLLTGSMSSDVLFDIGSGLGQPAILANIISGIKTVGIEYDPAYCTYASECASRFNLTNIEFLNANALEADYSSGTIFFMYTPFTGTMLMQMLEILKRQSTQRSIRIFTYGPCSVLVQQQNWLYCVNGEADCIDKLYEFHSK